MCLCRRGEPRLLACAGAVVIAWSRAGVHQSLPALAAQPALPSLWGHERHISTRGVRCRSGCKRQQCRWLLSPYALGSQPAAWLGGSLLQPPYSVLRDALNPARSSLRSPDGKHPFGGVPALQSFPEVHCKQLVRSVTLPACAEVFLGGFSFQSSAWGTDSYPTSPMHHVQSNRVEVQGKYQEHRREVKHFILVLELSINFFYFIQMRRFYFW